MMDPFASKDTLLRKADTLLGEARRVRKSASAAAEGERVQLIEHAEDLERQAARFERDAVSAKNGVFLPHTPRPGAAKPRAPATAATSGLRAADPLADERLGAPLPARRGRPPSS
jgi:hypothetical protein